MKGVRLRYLTRERLRSGGWRYRVDRQLPDGRRLRVALPGGPGDPGFLAAYEAALARADDPPLHPGAPLTYPPGSVGWLVSEHLRHLARRAEAGLYGAGTLRMRRLHLGRLVEHRHVSQAHPEGREVGTMSAEIPRAVLMRIRDERLGTPAAADTFLKSVSAMYRWAIRADLWTGTNPAAGIDRVNLRSPGYAIWTIEDVRLYLVRHRPGSTARLAMVACLCTAARRGDLVRLGPPCVFEADGARWLRWRQEKPPHIEVEIPLLDMLAEEVARHAPCRSGTWLETRAGRPRSKQGLGKLFHVWAREAGVGKPLHGVRKGLASILPEMGVSEYGVDVLLGHELGSGSSRTYTRGARRRAIAREVNAQWRTIPWE